MLCSCIKGSVLYVIEALRVINSCYFSWFSEYSDRFNPSYSFWIKMIRVRPRLQAVSVDYHVTFQDYGFQSLATEHPSLLIMCTCLL